MAPVDVSLITPTCGRPAQLGRVLDHLERQTALGRFEVVVVADAKETQLDELDRIVAARSFPSRRLRAEEPGASAARNVGWRAAEAPLVLFIDDDVFAEPQLVAEHLAWHERWPGEEVGVLGRLRWADELEVTPFMRWLGRGIHFDFDQIEGIEAGWGRFYTANSSVKRSLIERVGGFDAERLPFLYEDLDMALRMHEAAGFRLLYNRAAVAEHLHRMNLDTWKERVRRIAVSERTFVRLHADIPPYFRDLFAHAQAMPPARGRGTKLVRFVPPGFPVLGPRAWNSAEAYWLQTLAGPFFEAWNAAEDQEPEAVATSGASSDGANESSTRAGTPAARQ
jgi:GT2 family glycosyltransferase